ncbi:MAG TPA: FkbM family methyltransferase [Methanoregulaceae archaeon]|nr:FkbM family methyltransferase [Methanoregulaceae archaeon]HQN89629.1 FkbM family methyltransferase [Methanoregulaceae archaeon]HQP81881.1 FkbM family methyltransferase [Methanoregulaceae archaeon]
MDIVYLIEDLLATKNLQQWMNNRFKDPKMSVIYSNFFDIFPVLTTYNGISFYNSPNAVNSLCEVDKDYRFFDIRKDDRILDIGANIGGFSLPVSRLTKNVTAVEPLMVDELKRNTELNKIQIKIIEGALGNGEKQKVTWRNVSKVVETYSLSQLKTLSGGCDFLKSDCEGYEWFIKPEELKGVRRLELELHNVNPSENDPYELIEYILDHYETEMSSINGEKIEEFHMKFRKKARINEFILLHAYKRSK